MRSANVYEDENWIVVSWVGLFVECRPLLRKPQCELIFEIWIWIVRLLASRLRITKMSAAETGHPVNGSLQGRIWILNKTKDILCEANKGTDKLERWFKVQERWCDLSWWAREANLFKVAGKMDDIQTRKCTRQISFETSWILKTWTVSIVLCSMNLLHSDCVKVQIMTIDRNCLEYTRF